jgi:hypothetical protein
MPFCGGVTFAGGSFFSLVKSCDEVRVSYDQPHHLYTKLLEYCEKLRKSFIFFSVGYPANLRKSELGTIEE